MGPQQDNEGDDPQTPRMSRILQPIIEQFQANDPTLRMSGLPEDAIESLYEVWREEMIKTLQKCSEGAESRCQDSDCVHGDHYVPFGPASFQIWLELTRMKKQGRLQHPESIDSGILRQEAEKLWEFRHGEKYSELARRIERWQAQVRHDVVEYWSPEEVYQWTRSPPTPASPSHGDSALSRYLAGEDEEEERRADLTEESTPSLSAAASSTQETASESVDWDAIFAPDPLITPQRGAQGG